MPRLKEKYQKEIIKNLMKQFNYSNVMEVPHLVKIKLNMGFRSGTDTKAMERACEDLTRIAGQKAILTRAKKSIANFKLREGQVVGCAVTLRRERMYEFLDRLVNIAIPRIRDFRGYSAKSFDGRGNYNLGIREQIVFPEIDYDKIDTLRGLDIVIVTTAKTNKEGHALLAAFKFPFKEAEVK